MPDDVACQIADMERELLALTANQPVNPSQITTFKVIHATSVTNEVKSIVFTNGTPRFTQLFGISDPNAVYLDWDGTHLRVNAYGAAPITYEVVSLGEFSLV